MATKKLFAQVSGCSNIMSVTTQASHGAATSQASITCGGFSGTIGDSITIDLGYTDSHGTVFSGYVKEIDYNVPQGIYTIVCQDGMIRAVDFFVVPDDPNNPLYYTFIYAETLVGNVMALAGLTNYSYDSTSFEFAVLGDHQEVKLVTVYDFCKGIADLLAYALWYSNGTVYFKNRMPYYTGGGISATVTDPMILTGNYITSVKDLRNKVVVWGASGVHATASASSPYLPSGFYKTVVYSNAMIGNNGTAQMAADYNLAKLNRLGQSITLSVVGNHIYAAYNNIALSSSFFPSTSLYCYSCQHNWSSSGYTSALDLRW
jgi:hypothetical protein